MTHVYIPKFKPIVQYHRFNEQLYFKAAGKAKAIADPSGFIYSLCQLIDGKKSVELIKSTLKNQYPQEVNYLEEALRVFDENYLLEDAFLSMPAALTDYDAKRWSRNIELFGLYSKINENKYAHQLRLKTIKVALFGLGGLGSHILYDLVAIGVQNIRAVDYDKVELSNLNRQILYNETDLGTSKTEAAKKRIDQFLPSNNITFINKKITSEHDIGLIIKDCEIAICVADKPKKEMLGWLNAACVKHKVIFINGGVDVNRALYTTVSPGETGCIECWKSNVAQKDSLAHELLQLEPAEDSPDAPAVVNFVSLLTGLMLTEFLKIATKISRPQALGRLMSVDFDTVQIVEAESWEKNPECLVCGAH
ncbi:MAG TPA: ThiF family adenylyltransferase [Gammaproteobacteria bacterium]|nr:ThiF family adenylyltransferase [Gammaproteobacteria bacterium]